MISIKTRAVVSWSYGNWIYNYICNQCLSPLTLWVRIPIRRCALDKTLCEKVCHWLPAVRWFYPGTPVSSTNKTDLHDIAEILLKVALNTITPTLIKTKHTIWYVHTFFLLAIVFSVLFHLWLLIIPLVSSIFSSYLYFWWDR